MNSTATEIIKNVRIQRGLSQEQMAKDLGVSSNYISLIENDRKKPGMGFFEKVSATYNIPIILLAKDSLIPAGKTKAEQDVRAKVVKLMNDLERDFFSA